MMVKQKGQCNEFTVAGSIYFARLVFDYPPCGGVLEYLHRTPASDRRRRKRTLCLGV
jgi:hypothetical protein